MLYKVRSKMVNDTRSQSQDRRRLGIHEKVHRPILCSGLPVKQFVRENMKAGSQHLWKTRKLER